MAGNQVNSSSGNNPIEIATYKLVEFLPNGNENWQKEQSTTLSMPNLVDKVTSAKYCWSTSQSEPAESDFTAEHTFINGDTIKNNGVTGTYYLWALVETEDGNKNYCRSEGFNFDNTVPTIELKTEWITENEEDRLKITVTADDIHSGIDDNPLKIYIKQKNDDEEIVVLNENDISLGSISTKLDKNLFYIVSSIVKDKAGNEILKERYTGTDYLVKDGILQTGATTVWGFNTTGISASTVRKCI